MSSIVVNFPNCGEIHDTSDASENHNISVNTDHCSPPGPPPVIGVGELVVGCILTFIMIVAIAIVRYKAHEEKGETRRKELETRARMVEEAKHCLMCGADYNPALKEEK